MRKTQSSTLAVILTDWCQVELEEARTHESAMTHAGNVLVTRDPWPFDPQINGFPGLIVEHLCVKFRDRFLRYHAENTHTHTDGGESPNPATTVGVGNK